MKFLNGHEGQGTLIMWIESSCYVAPLFIFVWTLCQLHSSSTPTYSMKWCHKDLKNLSVIYVLWTSTICKWNHVVLLMEIGNVLFVILQDKSFKNWVGRGGTWQSQILGKDQKVDLGKEELEDFVRAYKRWSEGIWPLPSQHIAANFSAFWNLLHPSCILA
jgi:hypothetical protein